MKKCMIILCVAILIGTATASLSASNPEPEAQPKELGTESNSQKGKSILPKEPKLAGVSLCTPQDATEPRNEEGQTQDPEHTPEGLQEEVAGQTQEEVAGQTQEETPEGLQGEPKPSAPIEAGNLIPSDSEMGRKQYHILKNTLFSDSDTFSTKKIVTGSLENGSFLAEDLGTWLKRQDFYHISVVEDDGDYKTLYYERNTEAQEKELEKLASAKDAAPLSFERLVEEGDTVTHTDSCLESVTSVEPDGSFYTSYSLNWISSEN